MIMKIPNCTVGNGYYGCGDAYEDSNESETEHYNSSALSTPPNEPEIVGNYAGDFSEYLWMENEEEFDEAEMQRLEEEALMEQCIEAMMQDEIDAQQDVPNGVRPVPMINTENGITAQTADLCEVLSSLRVNVDAEKSTLNPLAAEFVPSVTLVSPATS